MSARNKLANKQARRAEREARKAAFHRRINLPSLDFSLDTVEVPPFKETFYWSDAQGNEVDGPELSTDELIKLSESGNAALTQDGEVIAILRTREEKENEPSELLVAESVLWTPGQE